MPLAEEPGVDEPADVLAHVGVGLAHRTGQFGDGRLFAQVEHALVGPEPIREP